MDFLVLKTRLCPRIYHTAHAGELERFVLAERRGPGFSASQPLLARLLPSALGVLFSPFMPPFCPVFHYFSLTLSPFPVFSPTSHCCPLFKTQTPFPHLILYRDRIGQGPWLTSALLLQRPLRLASPEYARPLSCDSSSSVLRT